MLHTDGLIRITVGGRTYVIPPLRGVAARRVYGALWRIIGGAKDLTSVAIALRGERADPRLVAMFSASVCRAEGWGAVVDEVLAGAKVVRAGLPDWSLPADADAVWSCRPSEADAVAWEALDNQGFFVVPGTLPTSAPPQVATPAASPPTLTDAV